MADAGGQAGQGGRGPWGVLLLAALAGLMMAPLGWWVTDRLEADNDFCNACHLEPGLPLHEQIRRDFDAIEAEQRYRAAGGDGLTAHLERLFAL